MEKSKTTNNSVKDNFMARTNADIFRVLSYANKTQHHILRVETAADLGTCRVYVNGGAKEFAGAEGYYKTEIAKNIKIRKVPALRFILDDGEKNTARVEELLKQIKHTK